MSIIGDQRRHPSVPVTRNGNCRYGSTARGGKRQHGAGQAVGGGSRQKVRLPMPERQGRQNETAALWWQGGGFGVRQLRDSNLSGCS
jgi:hypothetical protein